MTRKALCLLNLCTVPDAMLVGGKHDLNYSECMEILPTLNHYKFFKVEKRENFSKSTSIEIFFVKYGDQNQAITTIKEICKFHINPCNQNYAISREI